MLRHSGGPSHRGTAENISEFGMMLHTGDQEVATEDRLLWITFSLPDVPNVVMVQAEVVHERRDGHMISLGLKFMPMPEVIRYLLRAYIDAQPREPVN
jgi:hypothetical protein